MAEGVKRIIPIFLMFQGRLTDNGANSTTAKATTSVFAASSANLAFRPRAKARRVTPSCPALQIWFQRSSAQERRSASVKNQGFLDTNSARGYTHPRITKGVAMAAIVKTFGGAIAKPGRRRGGL